MNKKNIYLRLYLGEIKKPWSDYCARLGKKPGAAIKEAIEAQLSPTTLQAALEPKRPLFKQTDETPDNGRKARIEVRLTPSEKATLKVLADLENCSPQVWIVNVVRATLTHQPQCGIREIEILGESNYQLLAIGRNLNQIAKNLNSGSNVSMTIDQIKQLRELINAHTELVSKALRASVERWSIK